MKKRGRWIAVWWIGGTPRPGLEWALLHGRRCRSLAQARRAAARHSGGWVKRYHAKQWKPAGISWSHSYSKFWALPVSVEARR